MLKRLIDLHQELHIREVRNVSHDFLTVFGQSSLHGLRRRKVKRRDHLKARAPSVQPTRSAHQMYVLDTHPCKAGSY